MSTPDPDARPVPPPLDQKKLATLWAICCTSPILYLAVSIILKRYAMTDGPWFEIEPYTWSRLLIGLGVLLVLLQVLHLAVKVKARRRLSELLDDKETFLRLLTRRTFILIAISEFAVFAGFCLFLLQGDYMPVFGAGIAAMLLYGQSHPKLGLPPVLPP